MISHYFYYIYLLEAKLQLQSKVESYTKQQIYQELGIPGRHLRSCLLQVLQKKIEAILHHNHHHHHHHLCHAPSLITVKKNMELKN